MTSSIPPKNVAIIGAGLSGLSLALVLQAQSISCTIYESRESSYNLGGGIMLSPNALRILDTLGVYEKILAGGYSFESLTMKNDVGETQGQYYFGDKERYGYKALRVYRHNILQEMTRLVKERGVPIFYNAKFTSVLGETDNEVTFQLADGSSRTAALLIGADGIHSRVRRYLYPSIVPKYGGILAITSAVETSKLRFPEGVDFPLPVSISAKPGAFVIAPQDIDGKQALIGTQQTYPETDRAGWDSLLADKDRLLQLLRKDYDDWPDVAKSALENVLRDQLFAWPFHTLPSLDKWASPAKRVILLGDAAHAIPPTSGQGVNQAFEDTYSLGLLLSKLSPKVKLDTALDFWQSWRQERIEKILDLTRKMNNKRLPAAEQAKLAKEDIWEVKGDPRDEMKWLFAADLKEAVESWVTAQEAA